MVDADTITTLRRLLGEAKLGPLRVEKRDDDSGGIDYPVYADDGDVCICFEHDKYAQRARIYANLIAAAINALPALLDAVEGCVGCGMRGPVEAVERLLEVEAERDAASAIARALLAVVAQREAEHAAGVVFTDADLTTSEMRGYQRALDEVAAVCEERATEPGRTCADEAAAVYRMLAEDIRSGRAKPTGGDRG